MIQACEEDLITHYRLLGHTAQTEIRIFSGRGSSFFVSNCDDFVRCVSGLNNTENVYCGINQREDYGKDTSKVRFLNSFYFDIEGHKHTTESKCDSYFLTLCLYNELISSGLYPVIADSGGGYHIFISLSVPIEINDETGKLISRSMERIKSHYKGVQTMLSKIDIVNVSISKVERVIGTYNYRHGVMSRWLTDHWVTDTSKFLEWIDKLTYEDKPIIKSANNKDMKTLGCAILEYALSNKLPEGQRNQVVCPNFMATNPSKSQVESFASTQEMNVGEVSGWLKSREWKGYFSCPQMRNYALRHCLSYMCEMCYSEKKLRRSEIVLYGSNSSDKQAQGRLILT
jgi:hypothetical protein